MTELSYCFFMKRLRAILKEQNFADAQIEAKLSCPHFIKARRDIWKSLRNGKEVAKAVREVFEKFRKTQGSKGLFLGSAHEGILSICDTIEKYVFDLEEDSVPIWRNLNTEAKPVWVVERGTNLVENYRSVVAFPHYCAVLVCTLKTLTFSSHTTRV